MLFVVGLDPNADTARAQDKAGCAEKSAEETGDSDHICPDQIEAVDYYNQIVKLLYDSPRTWGKDNGILDML